MRFAWMTALLLFLPTVSAEGHLILIGGGSRPASIMNQFIQLSGGRDASILIIPTASSLEDTGDFYKTSFERNYGCTNVTALKLRTKEDAANPETVALIKAAGGIFLSGGDQRRIMDLLPDTAVGNALNAAFAAGVTVAGTSAGTACQSPLMITGDGDFGRIGLGTVDLRPGLGFFPEAILDQHFLARGRQNRLISAIAANPEYLGIGVGEATAIWRKPGGASEIIGNGSVVFYDLANAKITKGPGFEVSISGMVTHILRHGERFDLKARKQTK